MKIRQNELASILLAEGKPIQKKARGDSMLPAIQDGTLVWIEPVRGKGTIRRGDIVFIASDDQKWIIHRVIRFKLLDGERYVQTWGDNNPAPDPLLPLESVLGRVVALHLNGAWSAVKRGWIPYILQMFRRPKHIAYISSRLHRKLPIRCKRRREAASGCDEGESVVSDGKHWPLKP